MTLGLDPQITRVPQPRPDSHRERNESVHRTLVYDQTKMALGHNSKYLFYLLNRKVLPISPYEIFRQYIWQDIKAYNLGIANHNIK